VAHFSVIRAIVASRQVDPNRVQDNLHQQLVICELELRVGVAKPTCNTEGSPETEFATSSEIFGSVAGRTPRQISRDCSYSVVGAKQKCGRWPDQSPRDGCSRRRQLNRFFGRLRESVEPLDSKLP
jgi:hypothetical protein